MRQPKFRGYSLETNSWYYGHGWFEIDYTDEYLKEKGINQQAILYTEGSPIECELESMGMSTELKDQNDVEIHEGDILTDKAEAVYGKVYWNEDNAGFFVKLNAPEVHDSMKHFMNLHYNVLDTPIIHVMKNFYVTGNVYENPELLEIK